MWKCVVPILDGLAVQLANCKDRLPPHAPAEAAAQGKGGGERETLHITGVFCWRAKLMLQCSLLFSKSSENSRKTLNKLKKKNLSSEEHESCSQNKWKQKVYFIYNLSRTKLVFPTLGWTIIGYQGCAIKPHTIKGKLQQEKKTWI